MFLHFFWFWQSLLEDFLITYAIFRTYDPAGRLDTVTKDTVLQNDYEYDLNSNRTSIDGGTSTNATYDAQDRLRTFVPVGGPEWTYEYTDNGELKEKFETNDEVNTKIIYDYDVLGNLRGVDFQGTANDIEYVIDGRNRRVGKKVGGILQQQWLYKDQLNPIAELDSTGNVTKRFVYASRANIPDFMIIPSGVNAGTYRIVSDHLGSPRFVIDTAGGNTVQELDYDEWGNVLVDTNPGFTPFGFAGGLYDQDTKLVRFGARDYDPEIGRWTSKDPIRFQSGDTNFSGYVAQNPINFIDPDGKNPLFLILVIPEGAKAAGIVVGVCTSIVAGGALADFFNSLSESNEKDLPDIRIPNTQNNPIDALESIEHEQQNRPGIDFTDRMRQRMENAFDRIDNLKDAERAFGDEDEESGEDE